MQIGGHGKDILIGGFGNTQHHKITDGAMEQDVAASEIFDLAIEALLNGN